MHILRIPLTSLACSAYPRTYYASPAHTTLRCVCTGLRRWRLPDAWGHGLSILISPASPRTYYASPAHTTLRCVCTGLQRWRLPDAFDLVALYPRIHRTYYASLRMYGVQRWRLPDAWGHGLSILTSPASPRTYYAPLCMYGVTEIASSRRMGAWALYHRIPCIPPHILRSAVYVRGYRDSVFQTHCP